MGLGGLILLWEGTKEVQEESEGFLKAEGSDRKWELSWGGGVGSREGHRDPETGAQG